MTQNLTKSPPLPENKNYVLCNSWCTCKIYSKNLRKQDIVI